MAVIEKRLDQQAWLNIARIKSENDRRYAIDILEARRDFLELRMRHEPALRKIYIDAADNVARELRGLKPTIGKLTRSHLTALEKALREEAARIDAAVKALTKEGIRQAAMLGARPLDNHFLRAVEEAKRGALKLPLDFLKLQRGFADLNTAMAETFWSRTQHGLRVSDRIWQNTQHARDAMRDLIQTGIAAGRDPVRVARDLERYVRDGAKTLSKDYPKMMARMGRRIPKDLSYEALRLARTEYGKASFEAVYARGRVNPSYLGARFMLSDSHPEPDVCDDFATADLYNLGPGMYPKGAEPILPHVNCLCYAVAVLVEPKTLVSDLIDWAKNPASQEYLEKWYNEVYRAMFGNLAIRVTRQSLLAAAIKEKEDEIAGRATEKCYAFDDIGNVVFSKTGEEDNIAFSREELEKIKGTVFTHNHPRGSSFSPQDVAFAAAWELSEIRAVGREYVYSMSPREGWPEWSEIQSALTKRDAEVRKEFWEAINAGRMRRTEAEKNHFHEVWSRVAKDIPALQYRRFRR